MEQPKAKKPVWASFSFGALALIAMALPTWPQTWTAQPDRQLMVSYVSWLDPLVPFGGGNFFVPFAVAAALVGLVGLIVKRKPGVAPLLGAIGFAVATLLSLLGIAFFGGAVGWIVLPICLCAAASLAAATNR